MVQAMNDDSNNENAMYFTCGCHAHRLRIEYDREMNAIFIGNQHTRKIKFWYRVKMAWRNLCGHKIDDEFVFDDPNVVFAIGNCLAQCSQKMENKKLNKKGK